MSLWLIIYLLSIPVGVRVMLPMLVDKSDDNEAKWFGFFFCLYLSVFGCTILAILIRFVAIPVLEVMRKKKTNASCKFFRFWGLK